VSFDFVVFHVVDQFDDIVEGCCACAVQMLGVHCFPGVLDDVAEEGKALEGPVGVGFQLCLAERAAHFRVLELLQSFLACGQALSYPLEV